MKQFEIGKTYTMRSIGDHDCAWTYTVVKRTAKTITISDGTETKTCRVNVQVSEDRNAETIFPLGRYSMCPALSADKEEMPEVQEPIEEAEVEAKIITFVSAAQFVSRMVRKYGINRCWVWDLLEEEYNIIKGTNGVVNSLEAKEVERIIKNDCNDAW